MQVTKSKGTGTKSLYTGFFEAKVIAINPNMHQVAKMFGKEVEDDQEEIKYEGTSATGGDEYVVIAPWVEAQTPEKQKFKIPFYFVNKPMVWPTSKKLQFVSCTGDNGSADSLEELQEWFTHFQDFKTKENQADKQVRQAVEGEANWYKFLKPWLSKIKFSTITTNILMDTKELFSNVNKYVKGEYNSLITATGDDSTIGNIVVLAYVQTKENKEGELVHQQKFYSEYLGPQVKDGSRWIKTISALNLAINTNNWKSFEKFYTQLVGEHGCKGTYTLTMLQPFDPSQTLVASNDIIAKETTDAVTANDIEDLEF
jgi:hypothetical protein